MGPEQRQRLALTGLNSQYIGGLGAFENEYINSLVRFGIMGGIGLLLAFGSPLIAFARFRKHTDSSIQGMSLLGMLLPLMYMEFGLSVSVLSVNTCRQVYFSWCIVLLALILLRLRQLEKPNDQTAG
jgi:O-antigen ligase